MTELLEHLPSYLGGHVRLALVALAVGSAVSIPLGILATRIPWLERVVMGLASIIQTIPGLALLAVMVPALALLGVSSIGVLPALIGLTLYSLLPILRNTVTGIRGVDPALKEAAIGVGMKPWEQLRLVEIPLAMPMIIAGVRTSAVWVVGTATLSTPVGATSLGNYIFSGLQTRDNAAVLLGCVAAATLALAIDGAIRLLEIAIRKRRRALQRGVTVALGLAVAWAGVSAVASAARGDSVRIGTKTFTEQYVLGDMIARQIREVGGEPELIMSLGSAVVFDALAAGEIDVYVDYSGTLWTNAMKRAPDSDRERVLRELSTWLAREHDVEMLGPLGFENAYALAVRGPDAARYRRIGDLAADAPELTIGGDYEFFARPEWAEIQSRYGLGFADERSMDASLMYEALELREVDVISAFTTDPRIDTHGLVLLEDDRQAIPPYDAIMLASGQFVRTRPDMVDALRPLLNSLDATQMRALSGARQR